MVAETMEKQSLPNGVTVSEEAHACLLASQAVPNLFTATVQPPEKCAAAGRNCYLVEARRRLTKL